MACLCVFTIQHVNSIHFVKKLWKILKFIGKIISGKTSDFCRRLRGLSSLVYERKLIWSMANWCLYQIPYQYGKMKELYHYNYDGCTFIWNTFFYFWKTLYWIFMWQKRIYFWCFKPLDWRFMWQKYIIKHFIIIIKIYAQMRCYSHWKPRTKMWFFFSLRLDINLLIWQF